MARLASALADAVLRFDKRDEFLQKKIAVTHRTIGGIDVERAPAFGRGNQRILPSCAAGEDRRAASSHRC